MEQTTDALLNGHDFDHLVSTRLAPNRVAVGFRLLARTLAIGFQLAEGAAHPAVAAAATPAPAVLRPAAPVIPVIPEPRACRAVQVDGLGTFTVQRRTIRLRPLAPQPAQHLRLGWTRRVVRLAA